MLEGDDRYFSADTGHVDFFQNFNQPLDIRQHVGNDQRVGRGVGNDETGLGHHGGEQPFDFIGIGVSQGDQLGDELVLRLHRLGANASRDITRAGFRRGKYLGHLPRLNRAETIDIQHRLEHLVGLCNRYLGRRDDGNVAPDALVDDEVFAGQFADELNENVDIDIVEVDGDEAVL